MASVTGNQYHIASKTLLGNDVDIYLVPTEGVTSNGYVELVPASEPFEMEMDDSVEIDTTLRPTTGTVRFIVTDEVVSNRYLEDIIPDTIMGTKVTVYCGGVLKFFGYVKIDDYSQPYDSAPYEMELPVGDVISMMEDVNIEANDSEEYATVRYPFYYVREMMDKMGYASALKNVVLIAPNSYIFNKESYMIQREWFLSEDTRTTGSAKTIDVNGDSWADVFNKILLPFALCMYIENDNLYLRSLVNCENMKVYTIEWSVIQGSTLASVSPDSEDAASVSSGDMDLPNVEILSTSNEMGWIEPYSEVRVSLKLEEKKIFEINPDWAGDIYPMSGNTRTNTNSIYWQFHLDFTRQLELSRWDPDGNEMYASEIIKSGKNGYYGAVLGDMVDFDYNDGRYVKSIDDPSPKLVIGGWRNRRILQYGVHIKSPVVVCLNNEPLYLDINFSVKELQCTADGPVGPQQNPYDAYGSYNICDFLQCSVELTSIGSGDSAFYEPYFMESARLSGLPYNDEGSPVVYNDKDTESSIYRDSVQGCLFTTGKNLNGEFAVDIYVGCVQCNDGVGNEINGEQNGLVWLVSDFSVRYPALKYSGKLPEFFDSKDYTADAKLIDLPDEVTEIYSTGASNGEVAEIDLDCWGSGSTSDYKDNRTVQPNLPRWSQLAANQWAAKRTKITLDDARIDVSGGVTDAQTTTYTRTVKSGYKSESFVLIASGWKASNEGGKKVFLQVLS